MSQSRSLELVLLAVLVSAAFILAHAQPADLTPNPSFKLSEKKANLPGFWADTGDAAVKQQPAEGRQWYPQITTGDVKNAVPNSSFECGPANWGSFTYGLSGWGGNLYRLEGALDGSVAMHGKHSLKISLTQRNLPVFYFDYYKPVCQPVRQVLIANEGWFLVQPGEKLTLSAFLRADAEGVIVQLAANEAPSRLVRQPVTVGTSWQRHEFSFVPSQPFLFIAVGLDLEASRREAATLWIDSVQLERGDQATDYEPRRALESFIETGRAGNLFTDVDRGASVTLHGFNNSDRPQTLSGKLTLTDFFDEPVFQNQPTLLLPARSEASITLDHLCQNRRGFFRAVWSSPGATQPLRLAVFESVAGQAADSPLGFNHAYPWDFLVQSARAAGIGWWRNWSAQWQIVEPEKGHFDFTIPDAQIQRVLDLDGAVEVLLPFPASGWSTSARSADVDRAAGNNDYLRARLPMAFAPKDWNDLGRYSAQVARHYRAAKPRPVTVFQILNEPVYTSYALPRKFGYSLKDYLRALETAYRQIKAVDPQLEVVGGISANIKSELTRELVDQDGSRFLDVLDLHLYDPPRPAEDYEDSFAELESRLRSHGGPKPIWITEWGCYADDDPACIPQTVGNATANRCLWPSERAATEHIVKFTAVTFAHGLRKLFFHAGACAAINQPDALGVLFEYGGTPRKMLPGVAALVKFLGTPDAFVQKIDRGGGPVAYIFRQKNGRATAIAWSGAGTSTLNVSPKIAAYDIMGNALSGQPLKIDLSPVYLCAEDSESIARALGK